MRKNKLTGAIPGAGRPVKEDQAVSVGFRISKQAKEILDKIPRMQRGKTISDLITRYLL